jgi:hypothetical protein
MQTPNSESLSSWFQDHGAGDVDLIRLYRTFNTNAPEFREESKRHER